MTIRQHLKFRYGLMGWGAMIIPAFGLLWLRSSTPLNHTFRVPPSGWRRSRHSLHFCK